MININGVRWTDLRVCDIIAHLSDCGNESIFFEYKEDDVSNKKIVKEICGFANTYGGYLFLGVNDKGEIKGCKNWTEDKVHSVIYDSVSPAPIVDTKLFYDTHGNTVIVVRIEEGLTPPYISGDGKIYERVSSGTYPIRESGKLAQLNGKNNNYKNVLKEKIEFSSTDERSLPGNIYGYSDMGFSVQCRNTDEVLDKFREIDLDDVIAYLNSEVKDFKINKIGRTYVFSLFTTSASHDDGKEAQLSADVNFFMEIMADGSVRCRTLLLADKGSNKVNVRTVSFCYSVFSKIYSLIMGEDFYKNFVQAHKYEKLHVIKQFVPVLIQDEKENELLAGLQKQHVERFGGSIVISDNRFPKADYLVIDKRIFEDNKVDFNNENLIDVLFSTEYIDLGFINLRF